jgi:hypothetical protein
LVVCDSPEIEGEAAVLFPYSIEIKPITLFSKTPFPPEEVFSGRERFADIYYYPLLESIKNNTPFEFTDTDSAKDLLDNIRPHIQRMGFDIISEEIGEDDHSFKLRVQQSERGYTPEK